MKPIIHAIFRPVANRHYTSKKTSVILYSFNFFPSAIICLYGALFVSKIFWAVLGAIVIYAAIDYLVFDAFIDRLSWKLLWRRFYSDEAEGLSLEQSAMKSFDKNPTAENYEEMRGIVKR